MSKIKKDTKKSLLLTNNIATLTALMMYVISRSAVLIAAFDVAVNTNIYKDTTAVSLLNTIVAEYVILLVISIIFMILNHIADKNSNRKMAIILLAIEIICAIICFAYLIAVLFF